LEENKHISRFIEVLECYEHLLHAETQAIASKEIDLVESILSQKDECMEDLLSVKEKLSVDPREDSSLNQFIEKIIELQQRNFSTFSELVSRQKDKKEGQNFSKTHKAQKKVKQTYLKSTHSRISRLWD
jgi:hypothetical protein|tara:strand:- start:231 stop:617 length:387 start_codon:yes stop_codon:yes gene_type:complete